MEDIEVIQAETKKELVELLNEREKYHIAQLSPPYNTAPGGLGHTGIARTEERRICFCLKGRLNTAAGFIWKYHR